MWLTHGVVVAHSVATAYDDLRDDADCSPYIALYKQLAMFTPSERQRWQFVAVAAHLQDSGCAADLGGALRRIL